MPVPSKPAGKILVPQYMVSFGDMMTNVLTFFILLCSFSKQQEAGLMSDGVGSFKNEVGRAGIPSLTRAYDNLFELFEEQMPYEIPKRAHLNEDSWEEIEGRLRSSDIESLSNVDTDSFESRAELSLNVPGVFPSGASSLTQEQRSQLDELLPEIESSVLVPGRETYVWIIEAQTDSEEAADPSDALALSWERALAGYRYLTERSRLPKGRFVARGVASSFESPEEAVPAPRAVGRRFLRGLKIRLENKP